MGVVMFFRGFVLFCLISYGGIAHASNKWGTSIVIGETIDWVKESELNPKSLEAKLAKYMGRFISSRNTRCSAWYNPEEGEVYLAYHCLDEFTPRGVWTWNGKDYELGVWWCDKIRDICHTVGFQGETYAQYMVDHLPNIYFGDHYDGFIIHQQDGGTVVSYCYYKESSSIWYRITEYGDKCDTRGGSSGGMVVRVDNSGYEFYGVHTSGSSNRQQNYGSKI